MSLTCQLIIIYLWCYHTFKSHHTFLCVLTVVLYFVCRHTTGKLAISSHILYYKITHHKLMSIVYYHIFQISRPTCIMRYHAFQTSLHKLIGLIVLLFFNYHPIILCLLSDCIIRFPPHNFMSPECFCAHKCKCDTLFWCSTHLPSPIFPLSENFPWICTQVTIKDCC